MNYNDDMDRNWQQRLARGVLEQAEAKRQRDRDEKTVQTLKAAVKIILGFLLGWLAASGIIRLVRGTHVSEQRSLMRGRRQSMLESSLFGAPVSIGVVEIRPPGYVRTPPLAGSVEPRTEVMESNPGPWRQFEATGYAKGCTMPRSGIEPGHALTASGAVLEPNWTVAASREFPFGTILELSHAGIVTSRMVMDRGRAITHGKLDLAFADCERARVFGRRVIWAREVRRPLGRS